MLDRTHMLNSRTSLTKGITWPAAVLVVLLLAASCTSGGKVGQSGSPPGGTPASSPSRSGQASPPPQAAKLPLGKLTPTAGPPSSCDGPQRCTVQFEVSCPDVQQSAMGNFIVVPPTGSLKGVVVVTLGGLGFGTQQVGNPMVESLVQDGFKTVIIHWKDSWLQSASGEQVGPKRLGCRPATAIQWVYDTYYRPLGLHPGLGVCGFCLTGNSGGSSQIAYSLSTYGLANIVNAAVMSGGPPHAALAKGCLQQAPYSYPPNSAHIIDLSYGFDGTVATGNGPCIRHDSSYTKRWEQDSVDTGGVYDFPTTRVMFIFVSGDPTVGPPHGKDYLAKLQASHTPYVSSETIPGDVHSIDQLPAGRAAIETALQGHA